MRSTRNPVYPGSTNQVCFMVKEKVDQEKRDENDVAKGIVKFLVDVFDETHLRLAPAGNAGETMAIATIRLNDEGPSDVRINNASKRPGRAKATSTSRINTSSTIPPR